MLALIFVRAAMPIAIGSRRWRRCSTFAGITIRPRATSARTVSSGRSSRVATKAISGVIVPARAMLEVARAIGSDEDEVEVLVASNRTQVGFSVPTLSGRVLVTTRLLEGVFPDLDRVVPAEAATTVTIDREALSRAVKVASIFARDSAHNIRLDVTADSEDGLVPGSVTVSGSSSDHGDNQTTVPCQVSGADCTVNFSSEFLAEFLGSVRSVQVTLALGSAITPGTFRSIEERGLVHVIMPMHSAR